MGADKEEAPETGGTRGFSGSLWGEPVTGRDSHHCTLGSDDRPFFNHASVPPSSRNAKGPSDDAGAFLVLERQARLTAGAEEGQQHHEQVDEVEIESECTHHGFAA